MRAAPAVMNRKGELSHRYPASDCVLGVPSTAAAFHGLGRAPHPESVSLPKTRPVHNRTDGVTTQMSKIKSWRREDVSDS